MQKRKIDDSKIWEAYNRIINGESLTKVANSEDINLNRGTLKRYIELVVLLKLEENEKSKFEQLMNGNFRGNSLANKRKNRNGKRKRGMKRIEESGAMQELASYAVTPEQIEDLYHRLSKDKRTALSRDTYIFKCLEHLGALTEMGFTTEESFEIFMRRPKLFSGSSTKIRQIFNMLVNKYGNEGIAIQKLKEDPWIDLRKNGKNKSKVDPAELGGER